MRMREMGCKFRASLSKIRKKVYRTKKNIKRKRCRIFCLNVPNYLQIYKKKSLFNGKNSKKLFLLLIG